MDRSGPWVYVVAFSPSFGELAGVKEYIDNQEEFIDWYFCMPNAIFVKSYVDADGIKDILRQFNDTGRFLVLDVDTDRNGWLPKKAWDFMRGED